MCFNIYSCSKSTRDYEVVGYSHIYTLSKSEKELFASANISLKSTDVQSYPIVYLSNLNRLISAKTRSKATKRNNSCIQYLSGEEYMYGIVQKIFFCSCNGSKNSCFLLTQHLELNNCSQLCHDEITNAKLDNHIIQCNLRYVAS